MDGAHNKTLEYILRRPQLVSFIDFCNKEVKGEAFYYVDRNGSIHVGCYLPRPRMVTVKRSLKEVKLGDETVIEDITICVETDDGVEKCTGVLSVDEPMNEEFKILFAHDIGGAFFSARGKFEFYAIADMISINENYTEISVIRSERVRESITRTM